MKIYRLTAAGKEVELGQLDNPERDVLECIGDESRVFPQILSYVERRHGISADAEEYREVIKVLEVRRWIMSMETSI